MAKSPAAASEETPLDPNMPVIRLEHVSKVFQGDADEETRALDDVTVDIQRGEYVAVSGPSGAASRRSCRSSACSIRLRPAAIG